MLGQFVQPGCATFVFHLTGKTIFQFIKTVMGRKNYYAVIQGKRPGIYTTYEEVKMQINGYSGAKHKGFENKQEAMAYYEQNSTDGGVGIMREAPSSSRISKLKNKKKYYAVKVGKKPGVYSSWDECKRQTQGYPCAEFKSFGSYEEAQAFIKVKGFVGTYKAGEAVEIWTDGSCLDNQRGRYVGYSCYFGENDERNYYGGQLVGTNNVGEMIAVIKALEIMGKGGNVIVYTDSTYVLQGLNKYHNVIEHGNADEILVQDLKNRELWIKLLNGLHEYDGEFSIQKVQAHVGIEQNEQADRMAKLGAMQSKH